MSDHQPVSIRTATHHDVEGILRFWRLAADSGDRQDHADGVHALIARDPAALLLAERGGTLVGTLIAGWDGWRAHLYRLAVHPGHRRGGIARQLLIAAEARFRGLGVQRSDAMVLADNVDAHGLWSAAGYLQQEQWRRWIRPLA